MNCICSLDLDSDALVGCQAQKIAFELLAPDVDTVDIDDGAGAAETWMPSS